MSSRRIDKREEGDRMPIVSVATPPGAVPPARVPVAEAAPTPDERVEAPNVGPDDLADLARMDSDAG